MKAFLIVISLLSFNSFAGDDCVNCGTSGNLQIAKVDGFGKLSRAVASSDMIEDDSFICNPVRRNKFKNLVTNLKKHYNTTLKESYHRIKCDDKDIMGIIIDGAADRYFTSLHLQKYYEKDEKIPYEFSKVLLSKVNGQTAINRIEKALKNLKGDPVLEGSEYEEKLIKMLKKYKAYVKKYPVSRV